MGWFSSSPSKKKVVLTHAQRLHRLFMKHGKVALLPKVATILEKGRGKEEECIRVFVKEFGPEPALDDASVPIPSDEDLAKFAQTITPAPQPRSPPTGAAQPSPSQLSSPGARPPTSPPMTASSSPQSASDFKVRLQRMFETYDPKMLPKLDSIAALGTTPQAKQQLMAELVRRFGPEPPSLPADSSKANNATVGGPPPAKPDVVSDLQQRTTSPTVLSPLSPALPPSVAGPVSDAAAVGTASAPDSSNSTSRNWANDFKMLFRQHDSGMLLHLTPFLIAVKGNEASAFERLTQQYTSHQNSLTQERVQVLRSGGESDDSDENFFGTERPKPVKSSLQAAESRADVVHSEHAVPAPTVPTASRGPKEETGEPDFLTVDDPHTQRNVGFNWDANVDPDGLRHRSKHEVPLRGAHVVPLSVESCNRILTTATDRAASEQRFLSDPPRASSPGGSSSVVFPPVPSQIVSELQRAMRYQSAQIQTLTLQLREQELDNERLRGMVEALQQLVDFRQHSSPRDRNAALQRPSEENFFSRELHTARNTAFNDEKSTSAVVAFRRRGPLVTPAAQTVTDTAASATRLHDGALSARRVGRSLPSVSFMSTAAPEQRAATPSPPRVAANPLSDLRLESLVRSEAPLRQSSRAMTLATTSSSGSVRSAGRSPGRDPYHPAGQGLLHPPVGGRISPSYGDFIW